MKPYRIKHIESGLYYRPARGQNKSNLSTHGNVYLTKTNPLTSKGRDYIYIQVDKETRIFKKVKDMFPKDSKGNIYFQCPKEQFIIEEL